MVDFEKAEGRVDPESKAFIRAIENSFIKLIGTISDDQFKELMLEFGFNFQDHCVPRQSMPACAYFKLMPEAMQTEFIKYVYDYFGREGK